MKGTWNKLRGACFGPAWQSSGVQFMLEDSTEVARHLCPSVSRFVTEKTVHCSITAVIHTLYCLQCGDSDTISITYSTRYEYCAADMQPLNSILCAYVRKLLSVYVYFLPSVCGTCKWLPWTGLYWRTRNVRAIRLGVNYSYLRGRAENERADHVVALELSIPLRGLVQDLPWRRVLAEKGQDTTQDVLLNGNTLNPSRFGVT